MLALLTSLLLSQPPPEVVVLEGAPHLGHLTGLPGSGVARWQIALCKEHLQRLQMIDACGDDRRRWTRQTEGMIRYWELIVLARDEDFDEPFRTARLLDLCHLIGPERYEKGWTPFLMPEKMLPAVPVKPAGNNGA